MKRRLRYLFLWVLIIGIIGALVWTRLELPVLKESKGVGLPASVIARTAFLLDDREWTTFRIPPNASRLTLLNRAHFFESEAALVDSAFPYSVAYRLEKLDGQLVDEGSFDLLSRFIPMVDENGKSEPAAFFLDRKGVISTSRASTMELFPGELQTLKLRIESRHPSVRAVLVRVFQTRIVDQNRPSYLWNRLNEQTLVGIAERRVHGLIDLTEGEQLNILRNRPSPLGAHGIEGEDFNQTTLYYRNDLQAARRQLIEPLGVGEIRCNEIHKSMIGVPQPGGRIRLVFRRNGVGEANAEVVIRYFGESIHEREVYRVSMDRNGGEFMETLKPGLIEIDSPIAITIRPYFQSKGSSENLLDTQPTLVRSWLVGNGQNLVFSPGGVENDTGFFRLSVRPYGVEAKTIRYRFMDSVGNDVGGGTREIATTPSFYDLEVTQEDELPVNDAVSMILELSAEVAAVQIESEDGPCLVNGYLRPAGLIHRTRVPADYVRALPDPDRLPIWFGLRPDSAEELVRSHRSHLLKIQARPPKDDADILAGKYQWQDFQPSNGIAQYLFRERDPESKGRVESLPVLFAPLIIGDGGPVLPQSPPGILSPSRRLTFVRSNREACDLNLYIDGKRFFSRKLLTSAGEILLPPLPADFRVAKVDCESAGLQCFVNYVKPETATRLKRRAQRVSSGDVLSYVCEKATGDEELLTGMMFASSDASNSEIHVSIKPEDGASFLQESDSFTLRERSFYVAPDSTGSTSVLGGAIPQVDAGRRFFIPMGRDLSPGNYAVTITYRNGPGGFLTLSKVLGGEYSEARFFRETSR